MYDKILVPVDGSDLGKCGLDEIKNMAAPESKIILLRVLEQVDRQSDSLASADDGFAPDILEKVRAVNQAEAGAWLSRVAAGLKKKGFANVETRTVRGKAAEEIISSAEKEKVDAVIVTSHGRSGLSRWAFGSVTDKVMRTVRMPVLIVTPTGCHIDQD